MLWGASGNAFTVGSVVELDGTSWTLSVGTGWTDISVSTFQRCRFAGGTVMFVGSIGLNKIVCVQGRRREKINRERGVEKEGVRGDKQREMENEK